MLTKRTNILLTEEDFLNLHTLSQKENKTIGELVRIAIQEKYNDTKTNRLTQRQKALKSIEKITVSINTAGLNYKELIEDGRRY